MRRLRALAVLSTLLLTLQFCAPDGLAQQVAWEQWQHEVGIVDLGARSDGSLVAMAAGHLYLVAQASGALTPFSTGSDGFNADPNAEPYFAVAAPQAVDNTACSWSQDDLYILDLTSPPGLARVDTAGHTSRFATLMGVDTLGGIAFDTTGRFGHRLLVTGTHDANQTTVFALDCQGASSVITSSAPLVEGGLAIAPPSFGQFGGDLIASDENSDQVWAIDPTGSSTLVIRPGLASGGDTGVESEGFLPSGFIAGNGHAYLADRGTPDNPFPGTDSILRLSAATLAGVGVQDGDLLIGTEGNGTTVAIRCADTCSVVATLAGTNGGHIEGKIAVAT